MRFNQTGKAVLLIAAILACFFTLSAQTRQIDLSASPNQAQLRNNSDLGFDVNFRVGQLKINEIQTKSGTFDELSIEGWGFTSKVGEPKLPMLRKLIYVPIGADVTYTMQNQTERELSSQTSNLLRRIIPAQESISKSADPDKVPFILNSEAYSKSEYNSQDYIDIEEIGYMRGVRVFALDYYPVRYNPIDNTLKVMEDLSVRVDFLHPDLAATAELLARTYSYEFERMYSGAIFNWNASDRTSLMRYPTKMLILCPPNYVTTLQPFVDWKMQQGYAVSVTTVGTGGTVANTTAAIKTYMTNVWSAATAEDPAPSFLLIIGDTGTTGDNVNASNATVSSPSSSHITDNYYARLQGTDYLPELYYGRFSVSSSTELTNVINKTMTWQKTAQPDLSYLGNVVMIAGADATYAPTYGNGQINYGTTHYFNSTFGLTSNTYLYPESASSDAYIISNANAGRGYMNYTAHGSETSWADPTFSVSDVNAMTNTNKYGVMVGNCCVTNSFGYSSVCFGESIIRKANAGGVAYIGASNNSYWNEDYWWGIGYKTPIQATAHPYSASTLGAYDAIFHSHGEAFTDWAPSLGETNYMGNLAVTQSGSSYTNYYWEIYTIMGDPSLMTFMGVPTANPASYPAQVMIGNTSYAITGAAPYTRVGLTMNGTIYGSGVTDASGNLTLTITPFTTAGTAKLVLTAQNRITKIVDIPVIAASGPYMAVESAVYDDSNNDLPDYNENGYFDVTFKNVGVNAATSVSAVLTCSTSGVTITDNSHSIANLAAGASVLADNAYAFTIANNIANGTVANFTITMTMSGQSPWTHNFNLTLNAPALAFGSMTISDPAPGNNNGRLDPGETVTVTMPLYNTGGAASPTGAATMSCAVPGITINTGSASFSAISASGNANLSFSLTASSGMTVGTVVTLNFAAAAGQYNASKAENTAVGLIIEDFSNGNFNSFPWIQSTIPWVIVSDTYHSAGYAAKSGTITASGSTTLETTRNLTAPGDLSFWYKVSSESSYDYLKFYIDGTVQNQWSGTVDWTQATYTLAAGTRVLKWEYMKDGSVDSGSDCAWVDDIIFPASTSPSSFYPPRNLSAVAGNGYVNLTWQAPLTGTPTGYRIYRDGSLLTTVTGLSYADNAVVNETTYSYYLIAVYSGGTSDPSNTVNAMPTAIVPTEVIIGTGTSSNGTTTACPINQYYRSLHGQSVYTAAELTAAGVIGPINITQIGFNITGLPAQAMPNFVVRMGHTTAASAVNWISTGLTQVWSSASYLPTTTGWNMYTLSTPFLWNGTDNIAIDTAFGLIASYQQSGTTQYSTVTDGYRYNRSDSSDQTSIFTGGSTSTNRPNLKLALLPNADGPMIAVNPATLDYGDVAVGTNDVKTFTILNGGDQTLTGSITTPAGYTVSEVSRSANESPLSANPDRNTLSFSVNAGASKTYNLTFTPAAASAYNGNVTIANNSTNNPSVSIAVTGTGYVPPTINIDNDALYANLQVGNEGTDSFTITNTGSQTLTYSISMEELRAHASRQLQAASDQDKSIDGSTLVLDAADYLPGTTVDWTFTATNASPDTEWLEYVIVTFPAGVTVNSATNFIGGDGGELVPDVTSGAGVTITWFGENSSGWGVIYGNGDSATATVNVTIGAGTGGNLNLPYTLTGDIYGADPHTLNGSITLAEDVPPVEWLSVQPLSGSIPAGQSETITAYFSAIGMAVGTYEALITINSNDPLNPSIQASATMDVWDNGNHPPQIDMPASLSFDCNGSLEVYCGSYVSDEDSDPLSLACSGDNNINVAINGMNVTFTAAQNWTGSEVISFSVYDGYTYAYDSVTVTVNPVAGPGWTPVAYPNNSATVLGIVTIDMLPCALNDVVGAFVGDECRGVASVTTNGGNAYVTLLVNLASNGELISFRVFDYSANADYPAEQTYTLNFGQVIGEAVAVPINGTTVVQLDPPAVEIVPNPGTGSGLAWDPVPNATEYQIWRSYDPYGEYTLIATVSAPEYVIEYIMPYAFYKVVAVSNPAKK